jgi:hypothetical protein
MTTYNIKQAKKAVHPLKRAVMLQFGDDVAHVVYDMGCDDE